MFNFFKKNKIENENIKKEKTVYEIFSEEIENGLKKIGTKDTSVNPTEIMFKKYALEAVDHSKETLDIELDFSKDSIEILETILELLSRKIKSMDKEEQDDEKLQKTVLYFSKIYAGYLGSVIKLYYGGIWKSPDESHVKDNGAALEINGIESYILSKVYRRLMIGEEESITVFYKNLVKKINE